MEWQPIETAPKDGTKLLGYMSGDVADPYVFITWFMEAWQTGRCGGHLRDEDLLYWQPLPDAPKKKHRCVSKQNKNFVCKENLNEQGLILVHGSTWIKADYCPFCGEAANPTKDEPTMPFGKYEGKKISELPQDYIQWLRENGRIYNKEYDYLRREILNRKESE